MKDQNKYKCLWFETLFKWIGVTGTENSRARELGFWFDLGLIKLICS